MDIFNQIQQFVGQDNDFFRGGLVLALLGFLGAALRNVPQLAFNYVKIRLVHTLRVDSEEHNLFAAFGRLLNTPEVQVQTRTFRLVFDGNYRDQGKAPLEAISRQFNAEYFVFRHRGFTYYVDHEENKPEGYRNSRFIYRISAYWNARAAIASLMEALATHLEPRDPSRLDVYNRWGDYFQHSLVCKRGMDSLYYEPELLGDLLADIQSFGSSRDWYARLGIPYRRSYLLYGEPGTGKTSLIKGLASLLDKPVYVIGELALEVGLRGMFNDIPAGAMVVIEDFDRLFMKAENKLPMSVLLNQLDGLESKEGIMIFLTANHREVFDAALERPGRIDRKFYISYMGWQSARKMFLNFYGPEHLEEFAQVWLDGLYTPAQLQVYFSKYKHDPKTAVERFGGMLEEIGENFGEAVGLGRGDS